MIATTHSYLLDVRGSLSSITFTLEIGCKHSTADSDPKVDLIHSSSYFEISFSALRHLRNFGKPYFRDLAETLLRKNRQALKHLSTSVISHCPDMNHRLTHFQFFSVCAKKMLVFCAYSRVTTRLCVFNLVSLIGYRKSKERRPSRGRQTSFRALRVHCPAAFPGPAGHFFVHIIRFRVSGNVCPKSVPRLLCPRESYEDEEALKRNLP
jgi:hypothetical protein